ncbi:delta-class carbonic anhydrase [Labrenzia sp. CE80]|uniref:delta-class carbonic anhydrase n=1 Tax=Labrenzia sp. CE80 TaxID=1788986 RepID=UPI00129BCAA2|nr:delta-class carbonic anhydrase [Labrenzia sp. CE80]
MNKKVLKLATTASFLILGTSVYAASSNHEAVSDDVIAGQRAALAKSTEDAGFGPQAPRDISAHEGSNHRAFQAAPAYTAMNLCNIHFHENAEHKGGEFTTYAGNGDGHGFGTGFKYDGELTEAELAHYDHKVGLSDHGDLEPGDTIEVHYVYTTAKIEPGATLGSCLSEAINNPQLRVEAQVYVIVNDDKALNFVDLAHHEVVDGLHQATNIPSNTGTPVEYAGSTTGPGYNEKGSPFQVTWSVRPEVAKVSISSLDTWLQSNSFDEDHAHGVRNLVVNPDLLSAF